jgi:hypothetical protein
MLDLTNLETRLLEEKVALSTERLADCIDVGGAAARGLGWAEMVRLKAGVG